MSGGIDGPNWDGQWSGLGPICQQLKGKSTKDQAGSLRRMEHCADGLYTIPGDFDNDGEIEAGLLQAAVERHDDTRRLERPPDGTPVPDGSGSDDSAGILAPEGRGTIV